MQPETASTASGSDNEVEDVDLTDSFVVDDDDDDFDLPVARAAKKRLIQSMSKCSQTVNSLFRIK